MNNSPENKGSEPHLDREETKVTYEGSEEHFSETPWINLEENELCEELEEEIEEEQKKTLNQEVVEYFLIRRISHLFEFMCQHLIVNTPDKPVEFLTQLLDKCLIYRAGRLKDPPAVFEERHMRAVFDTFDINKQGAISIELYPKALEAMNLVFYEEYPETDKDGNVTKETFIKHAKYAQAKNLRDLLLPPPPENNKYIYPLAKLD